MDENSLNRMYILRKVLSPLSPVDSMEFLMGKIEKTDSNAEFLESMNSCGNSLSHDSRRYHCSLFMIELRWRMISATAAS